MTAADLDVLNLQRVQVEGVPPPPHRPAMGAWTCGTGRSRYREANLRRENNHFHSSPFHAGCAPQHRSLLEASGSYCLYIYIYIYTHTRDVLLIAVCCDTADLFHIIIHSSSKHVESFRRKMWSCSSNMSLRLRAPCH